MPGSIPGPGRSPGTGNSNPLQYSRLEKSHGQRSQVSYSAQGLKESDTTEQARNSNNYRFMFFLLKENPL